MASLPAGIAQSPDDEKQKQDGAPILSGGGSTTAPNSSGTTTAPSQPTGQTPGMGQSSNGAQKSAMQSQGSGYVNLQSYLTPTVAAQNQQQVKGMGTDLTGKVQGAFDTQNTTDNAAIDAQKPVYTDTNAFRDAVDAAGRGDSSGLDKLSSWMNQKYTAPTKSGFDLAGNADNVRLGQLGNQATAFDALRPELKGESGLLKPTYSQGNNWLDQSLIQGDAGTLGAIGDVNTGAQTLDKNIGAAQDATGAKATAKAADIAGAAQAARNMGQDYAKQTIDAANAKAAAANAQESSDQANHIVRDPNTGQVVSMPNGQVLGGWENGTGNATTGNFIDKSQAGGLHALAGLLGNSAYDVGSSGPYQSGRYTTMDDPNAVGDLQVTGAPEAKIAQLDEQIKQLQNPSPTGGQVGLSALAGILTGGASLGINGAADANRRNQLNQLMAEREKLKRQAIQSGG